MPPCFTMKVDGDADKVEHDSGGNHAGDPKTLDQGACNEGG